MTWLAIPLGGMPRNPTPSGLGTQSGPIATPETLLDRLHPIRTPNPESGWDGRPLASELLAMKSQLRTEAWVSVANGWIWWVVTIRKFHLAWDLILQKGTIAELIALDWARQRQGSLASPERCLVTPTGWIVDVNAACQPWIVELGLEKAIGLDDLNPRWTDSIERTFWPEPKHRLASNDEGSPTPRTSESPRVAMTSVASNTSRTFTGSSKSGRKKKPANRMRKLLPALIVLPILALGCLMWWPTNQGQRDPARRSERSLPQQTETQSMDDPRKARDEGESIATTSQSTAPEHEDALSLEASDNTEMTSIDLERISSEEAITSIDGHSLQSTLDGLKSLSAMGLEEDSMVRVSEATEAVTDEGLPQDAVARRPEGIPLTEDAPVEESAGDSLLNTGPSVPLRIEHSQRLNQWGDRNEVRYGRGVTSRNGFCQAKLELELEDRKDWSVQPQGESLIEGAGACEWRIAIEDREPEVMIRLVSKPGSRWQWILFLGAKPNPDSAWIQVAPGESRMVVERLQLHRQWIEESMEGLQLAPRVPRGIGVPDVATQRRWLQAQRRETERALERWETIVEILDVVAARGRVELQFSANPQTNP